MRILEDDNNKLLSQVRPPCPTSVSFVLAFVDVLFFSSFFWQLLLLGFSFFWRLWGVSFYFIFLPVADIRFSFFLPVVGVIFLFF